MEAGRLGGGPGPKRRVDPRILAAVAVVQAVSAALAYRDLARRPDEAVRGPKLLWRIIVPLNLGNSIAYWLIGRRSV